jgi:hypothetical protein
LKKEGEKSLKVAAWIFVSPLNGAEGQGMTGVLSGGSKFTGKVRAWSHKAAAPGFPA